MSHDDLEKWKRDFEIGKVHPPRHSTAFTSLALLSLAALGHQPGDSTIEGAAMSKGLDYVLSRRLTNKHGYYGTTDHSRMYGHGITTLMLAEMIGMGRTDEQDRLTRKRCEAALNVILSAQKVKKSWTHKGGWRYGPDSNDSDLSVTVWQLMALRSAKNAGLTVPASAIEDAIAYLQVCYDSKRDDQGRPKNLKAGFCYHRGRNPEFATTAAGVLAMQVCGAYEYPEVQAGIDYLSRPEMTPKEHFNWFFYGIYYYAQAMSQMGGESSDRAQKVAAQVLTKLQKPDGSFQGRGQENSRIYSTSMAILSLSIQHRYLPIYQR